LTSFHATPYSIVAAVVARFSGPEDPTCLKYNPDLSIVVVSLGEVACKYNMLKTFAKLFPGQLTLKVPDQNLFTPANALSYHVISESHKAEVLHEAKDLHPKTIDTPVPQQRRGRTAGLFALHSHYCQNGRNVIYRVQEPLILVHEMR
jgi:hypothetical protein